MGDPPKLVWPNMTLLCYDLSNSGRKREEKTMTIRRHILTGAVGLALASVIPQAGAQAQEGAFPTKPIRIIVPSGTIRLLPRSSRRC